MKQPCVYIMASQRNGTLYVGVTSHLGARADQHMTGVVDGFTSQHNVKRLVWFEFHESMKQAIAKEKALKKWKREKKLALIEKNNPQWRDLTGDL